MVLDSEKYASRVADIKSELKNLTEHSSMFANAGRMGASAGYSMAMKADYKINQLREELDAINMNRYDKYLELKELRKQRDQLKKIQFIKRSKMDKQIEEAEEKLFH